MARLGLAINHPEVRVPPKDSVTALRAVGRAPQVLPYFKELLRHRELVSMLATNDFRARHRGTVLGAGWNLLTPLLLLATYWLVFGIVLAGRRPENFLAFLAIGIFLFRFIQRSVQDAATSLTKGKGLIRSIHFPRAVLPVADVVRNALGYLWELPVVLLIVVLTSGRPGAGWLVFLGAIVPLAMIFTAGVALLFARVGSVFLDVKQLTPLLFRILFYLSGILFPIQAFISEWPLLAYLPLNPIYAFVTLARHYTLAPQPQLALNWTSAVVWTLLAAAIGILFFSRAEHRYSRD